MVEDTHKKPTLSDDSGPTPDEASDSAAGEHARAPMPDPMLERVIYQRYRLTRLIGRGAMGRVYAAQHVSTDQRFAVKLLSPSFAMDPIIVERFRREAMAASRLRHEGCVEVFDYGQEEDGTFFIVMEFIEGVGLAEELAKGGVMPVDRVAHIGVQLLHALGAAHASGVLHRDLKPQNIMLTQRFTRPDFVKVVDFGIAKIVQPGREEQSLTIPGTVFGTPEYMSPEQAKGFELDHRSDLFSAAVVLWQLLLGASPFRGASASETLQRVISGEPPRPSTYRNDVPAAFEQILLRAMHKDADARFSDVDAFREAIAPFVDSTFVEQARNHPEHHGAQHKTQDNLQATFEPSIDAIHMPRTEDSVAPMPAATKTEDNLVAVTEFVDEHAEIHRPKRFPLVGLLAPAIALGALLVWVVAPQATEDIDSNDFSAPEAAPKDSASAWNDATARARKAQETEDWLAAKAAWREAIRLRPDDARSHANLATLLWRQGKGQEALPHIERAMQLDDRYKKQFAPLHQMLTRTQKSSQSVPPANSDER